MPAIISEMKQLINEQLDLYFKGAGSSLSEDQKNFICQYLNPTLETLKDADTPTPQFNELIPPLLDYIPSSLMLFIAAGLNRCLLLKHILTIHPKFIVARFENPTRDERYDLFDGLNLFHFVPSMEILTSLINALHRTELPAEKKQAFIFEVKEGGHVLHSLAAFSIPEVITNIMAFVPSASDQIKLYTAERDKDCETPLNLATLYHHNIATSVTLIDLEMAALTAYLEEIIKELESPETFNQEEFKIFFNQHIKPLICRYKVDVEYLCRTSRSRSDQGSMTILNTMLQVILEHIEPMLLESQRNHFEHVMIVCNELKRLCENNILRWSEYAFTRIALSNILEERQRQVPLLAEDEIVKKEKIKLSIGKIQAGILLINASLEKFKKDSEKQSRDDEKTAETPSRVVVTVKRKKVKPDAKPEPTSEAIAAAEKAAEELTKQVAKEKAKKKLQTERKKHEHKQKKKQKEKKRQEASQDKKRQAEKTAALQKIIQSQRLKILESAFHQWQGYKPAVLAVKEKPIETASSSKKRKQKKSDRRKEKKQAEETSQKIKASRVIASFFSKSYQKLKAEKQKQTEEKEFENFYTFALQQTRELKLLLEEKLAHAVPVKLFGSAEQRKQLSEIMQRGIISEQRIEFMPSDVDLRIEITREEAEIIFHALKEKYGEENVSCTSETRFFRHFTFSMEGKIFDITCTFPEYRETELCSLIHVYKEVGGTVEKDCVYRQKEFADSFSSEFKIGFDLHKSSLRDYLRLYRLYERFSRYSADIKTALEKYLNSTYQQTFLTAFEHDNLKFNRQIIACFKSDELRLLSESGMLSAILANLLEISFDQLHQDIILSVTTIIQTASSPEDRWLLFRLSVAYLLAAKTENFFGQSDIAKYTGVTSYLVQPAFCAKLQPMHDTPLEKVCAHFKSVDTYLSPCLGAEEKRSASPGSP